MCRDIGSVWPVPSRPAESDRALASSSIRITITWSVRWTAGRPTRTRLCVNYCGSVSLRPTSNHHGGQRNDAHTLHKDKTYIISFAQRNTLLSITAGIWFIWKLWANAKTWANNAKITRRTRRIHFYYFFITRRTYSFHTIRGLWIGCILLMCLTPWVHGNGFVWPRKQHATSSYGAVPLFIVSSDLLTNTFQVPVQYQHCWKAFKFIINH